MADPLSMSKKELERLKVLARLEAGDLNDEEASRMLRLSRRQLYRLKARYRCEGEAGLVHRSRGRASNRGRPVELRHKVLALYRERYSDYGPTLFAERLSQAHDITLGVETLRRWLIQEGLWSSRGNRRRHRKKRPRRAGIGELVQFDGSVHDWFEGRAPACTLLVAIDDASSRVFMRFARSENAEDVLETMRHYVERHGIPGAIYTDGGSVYYEPSGGKPTDFAQAMQDLGIEMIRARSAQAKGRVERSNRTHQDRLIKALRVANISTIEQANQFLDLTYLEAHNRQFAVTDGLSDVHRSADGVDLRRIFAFRCTRAVNHDWTVRLNSQYLQLHRSEAALPPPGTRIELRRHLDGSLHAYWHGQELALTVFQHKPGPSIRPVRPVKPDHPWKHARPVGDKRRSARSRLRTTRTIEAR